MPPIIGLLLCCEASNESLSYQTDADCPRMSISIATFAYVGIEVVAASALEAKWPRQSEDVQKEPGTFSRPKETLIGNTVKFSAIFISILATIAYTLSGVLATLDISRADCQLPRVSWLSPNDKGECEVPGTRAAFVLIASHSGISHLADVFNAFLVFTCLSCASTNLYVASRTLFGLTSRLEGGESQRWFLRLLAWFGKTNRRKVPLRAMIFSALAFWWVPFLQLIGGTSTRASINMVTHHPPRQTLS